MNRNDIYVVCMNPRSDILVIICNYIKINKKSRFSVPVVISFALYGRIAQEKDQPRAGALPTRTAAGTAAVHHIFMPAKPADSQMGPAVFTMTCIGIMSLGTASGA